MACIRKKLFQKGQKCRLGGRRVQALLPSENAPKSDLLD